MDALPIEETKCDDNSKFISKNSGVMRACGHDAHLAILCCAAKILSFCFQPGEEGGAGAYKMIEENVLNKPIYIDQVYGLHVWS